MSVMQPAAIIHDAALATASQSSYHLTPEQIQFFDHNGYLILRNWIPQPLLERLQAAGHAWIAQGQQVVPQHPNSEDYVFATRAAGRVMFRANYLHNKGQSASLELLGSPQVLAVAESLCGPNFVPTYESMVFKNEGDGEAIPWHQDAIQPGNHHRIFNFDLYLDASRAGQGALRVIPGTHLQRQDVCALADAYGWDHPHAIDVEMEPGDVLLHNVMVVHGSAQTVGNALRRTIYYEFRPAEEIIEDGPWDRAWINRRLRLVPIALNRYQHAFPDQSQFMWRVDQEFRPASTSDEEQELKIVHVVHSSGSYCSAGDAGHKVK